MICSFKVKISQGLFLSELGFKNDDGVFAGILCRFLLMNIFAKHQNRKDFLKIRYSCSFRGGYTLHVNCWLTHRVLPSLCSVLVLESRWLLSRDKNQ